MKRSIGRLSKSNPFLLNEVLNGHNEIIWDMLITPDDRFLVSCSDDGYIKIWETLNLYAVGKMHEGEFPVTSLAISPDSQYLYSAHYDGTIIQWDFSIRKLSKKMTNAHKGAALKLAISNGGEYMASTGADSKIKLWSLKNFIQIETFDCDLNENLLPLKFTSSNSHLIAITCKNDIQLIDISTGKSEFIIKAHDDSVFALGLTKDDSLIITGSRDMSLKIWDFKSKEMLYKFEKAHNGRINRLCLALDDQILITGSELGDIKIWDLNTESPPKMISTGNEFNIYALTIDSASKYLVVGFTDGTIQKWDLAPFYPANKDLVTGPGPALERKGSVLKELSIEKTKSNELMEALNKQKLEMQAEIDRLAKQCEELKQKIITKPTNEDVINSLEKQIFSRDNPPLISPPKPNLQLQQIQAQQQQMIQGSSSPRSMKKSSKEFALFFKLIPNPEKTLSKFLAAIEPENSLEFTPENEAILELSDRKMISHYILRHWDSMKPKDCNESAIEFTEGLESGKIKSQEVLFKALAYHLDIEIFVLTVTKQGLNKFLYSDGAKDKQMILLEDLTKSEATFEILKGKKGKIETIFFDPKDKNARDKALIFASDRNDPQ